MSYVRLVVTIVLIPCLMYFKVIIVLYENVLYVKFTGMYYFTEKVDFKILQN